jgi:drug/metabolite transporter (DMT)-like permease
MRLSVDEMAVLAAPAVFVVLWASGFIGARFGLPFAEPLTFLTIRMIAVTLLLAVLIVATRPIWPAPARIVHNMVAGLLVHGLYLGGVFISMQRGLPAGLSALVVSLQPVLTSTLANRMLGERVILRQWFGLLLGLAGVYLVLHDKTAGDASLAAWAAAGIALLGITVGTLYQKRFGGGVDWRPAFFIQYGAAGLLYASGAFLFETRAVNWTAEFLFALAWLVFVLSFGAVWLLYFLIRRTPLARVASLFYLTPPFTALMAWALFDERLAPLALIGMAVCVAGVFLVSWRAGAGPMPRTPEA